MRQKTQSRKVSTALIWAIIALICITSQRGKINASRNRTVLLWADMEYLAFYGYNETEVEANQTTLTEYNITNVVYTKIVNTSNYETNYTQREDLIQKLNYFDTYSIEYGSVISGSLSLSHSVLWTSEGTLLVAGNNSMGQLGLNHQNNILEGYIPLEQTAGVNKTMSILSACTLDDATLFVTTTYKVYGMGSNEYGQIGVGPGTLADGAMPTFKEPTLVYNRGSLNNIKINQLMCGKRTVYGLTSSKKLVAWGDNKHFQIGNGESNTAWFPDDVIGIPATISKMEAGSEFAIVVQTDGMVYGWGRNWEGQLGVGAPLSDRSVPTEISFFSELSYKVKAIALGNAFSIFLSENTQKEQRLYTCGTFENNPLGLGYEPNEHITLPTVIPFLYQEFRISDIAAGETFGVLTTTNNTLFASGNLDFKTNSSIYESFVYSTLVNDTISFDNVPFGSKVYASKGFLLLQKWQCQDYLDSDYSVCGGNGQCFNMEETYCACDNGYFQENQKTVCSACEAGKYGVVNGTNMYCQNCPHGTYSAVEAAFDSSTCLSCPAGHYTDDTGQNAVTKCSKCEEGTYLKQTKDGCSNCPAGTFSSLSSQSSNETCKYCPLGFYSGTEAATKCTACPEGYITTLEGSTSQNNCTICPEGTYTFTNNEGTTICKECSVGTYSDVKGATSASVCSPCPAGTFGNGTAGAKSESFCMSCPVGTYSQRTGASSISTCQNCTSGTYSTGSGRNSELFCEACPKGTYGSRPGAFLLEHCVACPKGTYGDALGLQDVEKCKSCGLQQYQDEEKQQSCKTCPDGYFTNSTKKTSQSDCIPCPMGTYAIAGANNTINCTFCPTAYYQPNVGQHSIAACVPCPAGRYSELSGLMNENNCSLCPANTFSLKVAANSSGTCQPCPTGEFSNNGSSSCVSCDPGFKIEEVGDGSTKCIPCPSGTYSGKINNIAACIACPAGTYSNDTHAPSITSCKKCPTGTFSNKTNLRFEYQCEKCPAGTYNEFAGNTTIAACIGCSAGTFSTTLGAKTRSICSGCIKGTYQPLPGKQSCLNCPAGTYSTIFGSTTSNSCNECGKGTYSNVVGANSADTCQNCPGGTYQPNMGVDDISKCFKCPLATFSPTLGAQDVSTCKNCSNNFYADELGLDQCKSCPPGTVTVGKVKDSINSCGECTPGTYAVPEESTCRDCPAGTWNDIAKAPNISFCTPCKKGTFSSTVGATNINVCQSCPVGTASNELGANNVSYCLECPYGSFAPIKSSQCIDCPAGTFSNEKFQSTNATCQICPAGSWSHVQSKECTSCIAGTYSETIAGTNISVCHACPAGTASDTVGANSASTCYSCPAGLFSPTPGSTKCSTCQPGYYSPVPQSTLCYICSAGKYADIPALSSCKSCPPGTYSTVNGSITLKDCRPCAAGSVASLSNSTECVKCGTNQYCPKGSSASLPSIQQFNEPLSFIQNPQDLENTSDSSLVIIKWVPISLIILLFLVLFVLGMIVSCIIQKSCNCRSAFSLFRHADFFFKMHHHVQVDDSPTKRKTIVGGILTIVSCCIILALFYSSTIDLFLDNIILNESFKIGKAEKSKTDISKKSFKAITYFFGNFPNCQEFGISTKGFIGEIGSNGTCFQQSTWNGENLPNCRCEWACDGCDISGIRQTISFKAPKAFNALLAYEFLVPHYLENDEGRKELYRINGTVVPPVGKVIYGEPEVPTEVYFSVFNSKYISQSSLAPLMDLLVVFGVFAESGSTYDGLTSQHESTVIGGTTEGGLDENDQTKGIYVNFLVDVSKFIFLVEEISKQTTLNYLAQISALSAAVIGACKLILMCWEAGFYEGYRRYVNKPQKKTSTAQVKELIEMVEQKKGGDDDMDLSDDEIINVNNKNARTKTFGSKSNRFVGSDNSVFANPFPSSSPFSTSTPVQRSPATPSTTKPNRSLRSTGTPSDIFRNVEASMKPFVHDSRKAVLKGSSILKHNKDLQYQLNHWIGSTQQEWEFLYCGKQFSAANFHRKCDNMGPTICLFETKEGNIFGGYLSESWHSDNSSIYDTKSFVFRLYHPDQQDEKPVKFHCIDPKNAAKGISKNGPIFGFNDIYIVDGCHKNISSFSDLGKTYRGTVIQRLDSFSMSFLAGSKNFKVKHFEIFGEAVPELF